MSKRLFVLLILVALFAVGCGSSAGGDLAGAAGGDGGGEPEPIDPSALPPVLLTMEHIQLILSAGDYTALEDAVGSPFMYIEYIDMQTMETTEYPGSEAVGVIMDIAGGENIAFPENPGIVTQDLFEEGIPYGEGMTYSTNWMLDGEGEAFLLWGADENGGTLLVGIVHAKEGFPRG